MDTKVKIKKEWSVKCSDQSIGCQSAVLTVLTVTVTSKSQIDQ